MLPRDEGAGKGHGWPSKVVAGGLRVAPAGYHLWLELSAVWKSGAAFAAEATRRGMALLADVLRRPNGLATPIV